MPSACDWLPDAIVKALNTVFASNQEDPNVEGIQLDAFVAADDPVAKAVVLGLVASSGSGRSMPGRWIARSNSSSWRS